MKDSGSLSIDDDDEDGRGGLDDAISAANRAHFRLQCSRADGLSSLPESPGIVAATRLRRTSRRRRAPPRCRAVGSHIRLKGLAVVPNVTAAAEIKQRALHDAAQVLTATELQRLSEGLRDAVNTGYGTAQEDDALDLYQAQIQWPVTQRNGELRVWPFGRKRCEDDAKKKKQEEDVYALCSAYVEKSLVGDTTVPPPPPPIAEDAFFCIVGSVDGIREELVLEEGMQDDDELWSIRQSIVECKHRMQRIYATPPLYEQIQTALYCQMYQVDAAEIVQILRQPENNDDKQQQPSVILDVHRLHLDDPVLQHRQHWHTCLLPRLASVTAAIYKIRANDHARYCFLTALASNTTSSDDNENDAAVWKILFSHCDWLRDGDTAWARSRRNA